MESYRGISLLKSCNKMYSKVLNEKLKAQAEQSVTFGMPEWIASIHC